MFVYWHVDFASDASLKFCFKNSNHRCRCKLAVPVVRVEGGGERKNGRACISRAVKTELFDKRRKFYLLLNVENVRSVRTAILNVVCSLK
jgi:hypothetical protein